MRVVTYNIKDGGRPSTLPVVLDLSPDVVALQELRGGAPTLPGFAAFAARSWFGQPVAVYVRSGLEVLAAGPVRRPFRHAASRVVVATAAGPLTVVSAHLHPHRPGARLREARRLVAAVRGRGLALVCGDLNGLAPGASVGDLGLPYRLRHLRPDGSVDTRAVAALSAAGLVDLGAAAGPTVPTALDGAEFSVMRLDYLFGTPAVAARVRSCRVVTGGAAETASDHHPVLVDLDL